MCIIINLFYYILKMFLFCFFWCPCMAINVSVQHNNGFSPGIILLIQCYYHRETRFKCHEEVFYVWPMIPSKRFDIFPPDWGMLRRSRCVQIFLYTQRTCQKKIEEGHSIERVWYSASREPFDTLPGSQPCTQTHSIYHTPYSHGFRLLERHSRRRLGRSWVGPINAAQKRPKLATVTQVQPQPCPPLPLLFSFADVWTHFLVPYTHAAINLQPPPCTVLYQTPGSSAAVHQSPVMPNSRRSYATQSVHYFSFPPGPRFPAFSSSPGMTLLGLPMVTHAEQRPRPEPPTRAHGCFDALAFGSLKGVFVREDVLVRQLAPGS